MAKCRLCNIEIDKEKDDWILPSKNWYYHKKCYDNWKQAQPDNDKEYIDLIYDFIAHDLKKSYDWWICENQRKKFIKEQKMTNKGILFALKYFYEIKKGDWEKGHGGIGIVPFIYKDSCSYWAARERRSEGTIAEIERQMREAAERQKVHIKKKEKAKYQVDFSILDDLEDEE